MSNDMVKSGIKMRNRYGIEYRFHKISDNEYQIIGELSYCRFGGKEGQLEIDPNDLGFVDPAGGPFIDIGYIIDDYKVVKISSREGGIFFTVEKI